MPAPRFTVDDYVAAICNGDRTMLGRAITLVESLRPEDNALAQEVLTRLLPHTGGARRVGITGVPGVGKSTFIDALGTRLTDAGHRVAVLAVDPSSALSGGSILGDKSRMPRLAVEPNAFIRPSPSARSLGGVTRRTRESMLVCEAAGFDVILVETVGVGQSETMVSEMVDFFLVLMLPGAGDELQGIKKGILELADLIAVNKADGDSLDRARSARAEYAAALRYQRTRSPSWKPEAITVSALTGDGLDTLWGIVEKHRETLGASGELEANRRAQQRGWMWSLVDDGLQAAFRAHPAVQALLAETERQVLEGSVSPTLAAAELLRAFGVARAPGE